MGWLGGSLVGQRAAGLAARQQAGWWFVGSLAGRLARWLAGWQPREQAGSWLVGWLAASWADDVAGVGWLADGRVGKVTKSQRAWGCLAGWLAGRLNRIPNTNQLAVCLTACPPGWIGWVARNKLSQTGWMAGLASWVDCFLGTRTS
jgi:hypothetical protein